jgi:hypothetical protein
MVILFENNSSGTVIVAGKDYEVGHYSTSWYDVTDSDHWEILAPGSTVILTQE